MREKKLAELRQFLHYLESVWQNQYVTSYEDEDSEGQPCTYVSLDVEYDEYHTILRRLKEMRVMLDGETPEQSLAKSGQS